MTCDELELLLPEGADDPAVQAHLAQCASCLQSAEVLAAAAQPPLSPSEKAKLGGLSSAVQGQWVRLQHRRGRVQQVLGLAVAAALGAVIASGVMWKLNPARPAPQPLAVEPRAQPQVLVVLEDASPLAADDESSFEVSWPSLNEEGDVL